MTFALAVTLAFFGVVVAVGVVIDRRLRSDAKLGSLPLWGQLLVGAVAMTPFVLGVEQFGVGPIDGTAVAFAVSVALWIALPTLLARVVTTDPQGTGGRCA